MSTITTAAEVYAILGNALLKKTPLNQGRILLRIERSNENAQSYGGIYVSDAGWTRGLDDLPSDETEAVEQLHRIMTQGGNNEWNLLYFTLLPGGAFEVDFIQDEDAMTSLAYLARTRKMPEAKRRAGYRALMKELAQARATRLYAAISERLPALAAAGQPGWQRLVLRAVCANGGMFKLKGFAYTDQPDQPQQGEQFSVMQDWELVKQFYEFNQDEYQPMWNQLEWTVRPDGTYSLIFDWDPTNEPSAPLDVTFPYTREGRWQEPA